MAFDFNEAREIVEAAKKRGLIRSHGDTAPLAEPKQAEAGNTVFPDWLNESIRDPARPTGFDPDAERPRGPMRNR
jgi:hypothetical protein